MMDECVWQTKTHAKVKQEKKRKNMAGTDTGTVAGKYSSPPKELDLLAAQYWMRTRLSS